MLFNTLKHMHYAENALTKALPKVIRGVSQSRLEQVLRDHLAETEQQISLLGQVFNSIGKKPEGKWCEAIEGLIKGPEGILAEAEGRNCPQCGGGRLLSGDRSLD